MASESVDGAVMMRTVVMLWMCSLVMVMVMVRAHNVTEELTTLQPATEAPTENRTEKVDVKDKSIHHVSKLI